MVTIEKLAAEIRRITECPYVPNLKGLHDILENIQACQLDRWARGNECQIGPLAEAVLEGLELWPFCLDTVRIFSCITPFRDAVLQRKPMLLDTLLRKALESEHGYEKFASTCVSLLSSPLDIAIPSAYPAFLERALGCAARSLTAESLRPVYQLFSTLGPTDVDVLSQDVLNLVQDEIIKVLGGKIDLHSASLLCLAVLARLASRNSTVSDSSSQQSSAFGSEGSHELSGTFASAQHFFSGRKAHKTLDLVVLKCIAACSGSSVLSQDEAIESLKLSGEIADAIESTEKRAWSLKNTAKVRKLCEKILRPNLDVDTRCAALNFYSALSDDQPFPDDLLRAFESSLLAESRLNLSSESTFRCLIQLGQPYITQLLLSTLELALRDQWRSLGSLLNIQNALQFVNVVIEKLPTSPTLCKAFWNALSQQGIMGELQRFAVQDPGHLQLNTGTHPLDTCPSTRLEVQIQLHRRLCVILLSCAIRNPQLENANSSTLYDSLLEKQARLADSLVKCPAHNSGRRAQEGLGVSLFESRSTPKRNSVSHGWKETLNKEMLRDASHRYESVIRVVGEICRDLELRCEESERPFREEQSKCFDLQARLEAAQEQIFQLEATIRDRNLAHCELENENTRLHEKVEKDGKTLNDVSANLDRIHEEFDQAKLEAELSAQAANESARQQDLAYLATLTGKDEMYEEQAAKMASIEDRAKSFQHELYRIREEMAVHIDELQSKDKIIEELQRTILAGKMSTEIEQARVRDLLEEEKRLIASKQDLEARMKEASRQSDSLVSNLRAHVASAEAETVRLWEDCNNRVLAKDDETRRLGESHRVAAHRLEMDLEDAREKATSAIENNELIITELRKENRKLRKDGERYLKELAEAEDLRGKLVAIMGIKPQQTVASSTEKETPSEQIRSQSISGEERRSDQSSDTSFGSGISSDSGGQTSKRNKTHGSFQLSSRKDVKTGTAAKSNRRLTVKSFRTPLADLKTQNRVVRTPTHTRSDKTLVSFQDVTEQGRGGISDEEEFDGADLFTSTDQQQLSALRRHAQRPMDEETTMEF